MWALSLLAADNPLDRTEILWGAGGLIAALLAGAVAISLVDRWRKRTAAPVQDDTDELATYRELHEQGELTDAEYAELRRKLADKTKAAPAAKPEPVAGAAPEVGPTSRSLFRPKCWPSGNSRRSSRRPTTRPRSIGPRRPPRFPNHPRRQEPPSRRRGQNPHRPPASRRNCACSPVPARHDSSPAV